MPDAIFRISTKQIYVACAVLLVVVGAANLLASARYVNDKFGGFLWVHDDSRNPPYYVGPVPWRTYSPSPDTLHFLDTLLSVDGQPAVDNPELYSDKDIGTVVTYSVLRGDVVLTVTEPVRNYTLDLYLLIQGMIFLIGLSAIVSGYSLLAQPCHPSLTLVAFSLLLVAGAAFFFVGEYSGLTPGRHLSRLPWLILGAPTAALIGAMLLHAALLYPESTPVMRRFARLPVVLYTVPIGLNVAYAVTSQPDWRSLNEVLLRGMHGYAALCFVGAIAVGFTTYQRLVREKQSGDVRAMQSLLLVWGTLTSIVVLFWLAPYIVAARPILPYEVLGAFLVLFPIGLAYGLRHSQNIRILAAEQEQVLRLRQSREQTAHLLADHLHDTVLPELHGTRLLVDSLHHSDGEQTQDEQELAMAVASLEYVTRQLQQFVEGIKPMDWSATSLQAALQGTAERYQHRKSAESPIISYAMDDYDEADPPLVKDALFAVGRLALDNAYRHAHASTIQVELRVRSDEVNLSVIDNGVGFDRQAVQTMMADRRHLGLANMQRHAAEIGGALTVTSSVGSGTRIGISVPRQPIQ